MSLTRGDSEKLAERLRYEEGLASCSRSLIAGGPRAIDDALEHLRMAAGASRVYLFENFDDPQNGLCMRQTHEACAPGVEPQIDNPLLQHLHYATAYEPARRMLSRGQPFWGIVDELDEETRGVLAPQGILSILNIPVSVTGAWYGFIGFDDTESPRAWSEEDVRLLLIAAEMVGAHIGREKAVQELARRQAKMDGIFRTAPSGIGTVIDRVLTEVNDRLCRITGYGADEMLGRSTRFLYSDQAEYERVGREQSRNIEREGTGTIETHWIRKDGIPIDILLSSSPIVRDNLQGDVIFTALDITDRVRAERERRAMESQVQHVQKLESLGILAGGIAHDFNNLLMVVLGNLDLVLTDRSLPAALREELQNIGKAARQGAELTRQLLVYAGREPIRVTKLDLSTVVREMSQIIEISLRGRGPLVYELAEETPAVDMDPALIRQVIMNLLTNASESLGTEGGRIVLRTGQEDLDSAALEQNILGRGLPAGTYAHLEIQDTGCGMDGVTRERIFDPFFSTKFIGRGLGLAAVHGIVLGHHGCMRVTSDPGKGTSFRVMFPAAPGA
jgi:two-component system, cell cycle sensor histidine kinase and response regulator CckA